jgi:radical SAM protein with 4Fe4S-binding SPASM domain
MITAKTDGDRSPLTLRLGRAALRRVFSDPALNGPTPGAVAAARDPDEVACGAGHTACYVSAYGDVSPCVSMPIVCGNVREQRLSEIWERSARMQEVRAIRVRDLPICSRCAASSFCTRCPGQALVEDGDLYGPSTAACEHARVAAEVAGADVIPLPLMRLPAPSR